MQTPLPSWERAGVRVNAYPCRPPPGERHFPFPSLPQRGRDTERGSSQFNARPHHRYNLVPQRAIMQGANPPLTWHNAGCESSPDEGESRDNERIRVVVPRVRRRGATRTDILQRRTHRADCRGDSGERADVEARRGAELRGASGLVRHEALQDRSPRRSNRSTRWTICALA